MANITRYIAVDSGKSNTKIAVLNPDFDYKKVDDKDYNVAPVITSIFRTKYDKGTFEDDEPGRATYLCEFEGQVYKIGRAATIEAELENSKKTFIHKLCTMFAIAREVSKDTIDDVVVGIGIPVADYLNVDTRNEYREYILPLGKQTVKYRNENGEIVSKTFNIIKHFVYPESIGAIFSTGVNPAGTIGVIDIGHLNVNLTLFNGGEPEANSSTTSKNGANALVSGLQQKLSSKYSFINKSQTAELLCREGKDRCLKPVKANKQIEEDSAAFVDEYVTSYVNSIKEEARSANWSIDYTQFVIIGGTTKMITDDLIKAFGEETIIPSNGNYVNVIGFLVAMCARKDTLRIDLSSVC